MTVQQLLPHAGFAGLFVLLSLSATSGAAGGPEVQAASAPSLAESAASVLVDAGRPTELGIPGDVPVFAVVGTTTVTAADLFTFSRRKPFMQQRLGSSAGMAEVLRHLIENRLINMAATERAGLKPGADQSEFLEAVSSFKSSEFSPDPISPADIEAYYKAHEQSLGIPASVRIRDIVVPFPPGADTPAKAAARAQADALRAQAKSGKAFEALAAGYADTAALRRVAGDRGYVALSDYPYLQEATANMQIGDLSDVIELPTGYQVFQLLGRRQGLPVSLEEAEVEIRRRLQTASVERKRQDFFQSYGNKLGVRVTVPALTSAWPWPAPAATDPATSDP